MVATYFTDYDPLLIFDFVPDDGVAAFVETLEKLYWRHVDSDEDREDWLTYLRHQLKGYVRNFDYRMSGRFLLRLFTLHHLLIIFNDHLNCCRRHLLLDRLNCCRRLLLPDHLNCCRRHL